MPGVSNLSSARAHTHTQKRKRKRKEKTASLEGYKMHVKERLKDGAMSLHFLLRSQETKITPAERANCKQRGAVNLLKIHKHIPCFFVVI